MAHAQDVDGRPFVNERVCFNVDDKADGVFGFSGTADRRPGSSSVAPTAPLEGQRADVCRYTDANGNAAVEVLNSDPQTINVIADFEPEGLLRRTSMSTSVRRRLRRPVANFDDAPPVDGPARAADVGRPEVGRSRPASRREDQKRRPSLSIRTARLVKKGNKVYLVVKVKSNARYARLRVKALGKHGRMLGTKTKRIRTNRTVKLRVSAKARAAAGVPRPVGRGFSQRIEGPLRRALVAFGPGSGGLLEGLGLAERADQ